MSARDTSGRGSPNAPGGVAPPSRSAKKKKKARGPQAAPAPASAETPKPEAPKEPPAPEPKSPPAKGPAPRSRVHALRVRKRKRVVIHVDPGARDEEAPPRSSRPSAAAPPPAAPPPASEPAEKKKPVTPLAIALAVALGAGGIYLAARSPAAPASPSAMTENVPSAPARGLFDAIPSGAMIVINADVRALRASPLAAPYLGGGQSVPGFGDIQKVCGFDPIATIDEIAIGVPAAEDASFGVVATGGFSDATILDCASKVVRARGGRPETASIGSFKSVRDAASPSSGETAARAGGPLVWGGGSYLRAMLEAADGRSANIRADAMHGKLRGELTGYETVQATFVLSEKQRATIADEMQKAQGKAPAALAHVVGASLGLRLVNDKASILVVVLADDPANAGDVRAWLESSKKDASASLASKLLGASPLLDRADLEVRGGAVHARLEAQVSEIEGIVERALQFRALLEKRPPPAPSSSEPAPSAPSPSAPSPSASEPVPSSEPVPPGAPSKSSEPARSSEPGPAPPAPSASAPRKRRKHD